MKLKMFKVCYINNKCEQICQYAFASDAKMIEKNFSKSCYCNKLISIQPV